MIYLIVGIFLIVAFCYYENNVFDITRLKVSCNNESELKIIQLSDLHSKEFGYKNKRLKKIIINEKPDIVVMTGDMIDSSLKNMDRIIEFIIEINKCIPVVYIPGNNEMRTNSIDEIIERLKNSYVIALDNEIQSLEIKGQKINFLGLVEERIDNGEYFYHKINSKYIYKNHKYLFRQLEKLNGINIVLSHYPENFEAIGEESYCRYDFNIMMAGHAHGGQFILPVVGGLFAPGQGILPKYYKGVHGEKNKLIISRGMGNSGFPLRLFNRPEIIVITLI